MNIVKRFILTLAVSLVTYNPVSAQEGVLISTVNESESEQQIAGRLAGLLREYDVEKWIFTRKINIDQNAYSPHSHPVLTLTTRYMNDTELLSSFIHEQLHWFEEENAEAREAAVADFMELYPNAPDRPPEGSRGLYSTYLHLIVCFLEYEAMKELVGTEAATESLASRTYYRWVYRTVLEDNGRIKEVTEKHGLTL